MRKISEIIRSEAKHQFNRKIQQIIHKAKKEFSDKTGKRFEDVLNMYMDKN